MNLLYGVLLNSVRNAAPVNVKNVDVSVIDKILAWFHIPRGLYCYKPKGWDGRVLKVKHCPHWYYVDESEGFCSYLMEYDWLLWDSVKVCGIKE